MRSVIVGLLIATLVHVAQADQFVKKWSGRDGLKAVVAGWPEPAAEPARSYWEQFEGRGNWTNYKSLRKYREARRDWLRVGPAQVGLLTKKLSSSEPWERYVAAVLLGGTHSPQAIASLRGRLAVERHLDVGYALEGALAELGDQTQARVQKLFKAELQHRKELGRDAELRSIYLIQLVCNVHRPEAVEPAFNLKSDDGGIAEVKRAALQHMMADMTGVPKFVAKGRKVDQGRFHSSYSYPQLRGMVDLELQEEINRELAGAFAPKPFKPEDEYFELREFEVTRLDVDCISVVYRSGGKLRGAGSHNRTCTTRTINLHTGRAIELTEVLRGEYLEVLRNVARPLAERQFQFDMAPDFLAREPRFYLTPKKLVLLDIFQDGLPTELPIPMELLQEVINPDGPMAGLLGPQHVAAQKPGTHGGRESVLGEKLVDFSRGAILCGVVLKDEAPAALDGLPHGSCTPALGPVEGR